MTIRVKVADAKTTHLILQDAIARLRQSIENLADSEHPQVIAVRKKQEAELGAFEAVAESLTGNHVSLRLAVGSRAAF